MENKSPELTDDSPASLPLLPGELLIKIMSLAMASDVPVFLWLFRNLTRVNRFYDSLLERAVTKPYLTDPELPQDQQQHLQDWVSVTGTCRRLREFGIPAFFREKSFVVPPRMLGSLLDGRIRSSNFDMAMDCIHKVVVPVSISLTDYMSLPYYRRFTNLTAMTIRVPDSQNQILSDTRKDRSWPQEAPKELHRLLKRLGLQVDITKLQIIVMTKKESAARPFLERFEGEINPRLRTLIERMAKRRVALP